MGNKKELEELQKRVTTLEKRVFSLDCIIEYAKKYLIKNYTF